MAAANLADVGALEEEFQNVLKISKLSPGGGGGGGGMPKVQFEQLHAAIAKDGCKALAAELELQKKKLKEAETNARNLDHAYTVEKQLRDTEVEQEKKTVTAWKARATALSEAAAADAQQLAESKRVHAELDTLVKAQAFSNAALRKQHDADIQQLAKSNRNQKKILENTRENNEKLKDKLLARIRALNSKVARDHGGDLEAWKEKILTTSKKAEASITNNGFTHNGFAKGIRRYNAIVKSLATAETEVRQTRDDIKKTANEAIAKKTGEIATLNKKARNAVAALNQKGEENETKIKAVEKVIKSKEDEIQSLQDTNLGRRDIAPVIKELEREIEAQKEIIKKYRSAARTNVTKKAQTKIAEGDKTVNRLTALQTQFNELGLSAPAPVLGPSAPAPDSGSSWTRSMLYGLAGVGVGTVGTLAATHRPSMPALPSLWGGNSGTAGGGGAKLTPRGGNGDNGKWPVDEL